ncbi:TPA: FMN-binding negative transcriptional regulator [Mannheimia haemolytica]
MYNPSKFKQTDRDEICRFMQTYPFATVVANTQNGLDAAHIPILWRDDGSEFGCLLGHFARGNSIWKTALPNQEWLVIFENAGHYISANYYPSKMQDHKVVPTWNFQAVHAKGILQLIENVDELKALLSAQTAQFEGANGWQLSDAPDDYILAQCKGIVGFKLEICQLEGKYKLSQNQNEINRQGVISGLQQLGTPESEKMAALVQKYNAT